MPLCMAVSPYQRSASFLIVGMLYHHMHYFFSLYISNSLKVPRMVLKKVFIISFSQNIARQITP